MFELIDGLIFFIVFVVIPVCILIWASVTFFKFAKKDFSKAGGGVVAVAFLCYAGPIANIHSIFMIFSSGISMFVLILMGLWLWIIAEGIEIKRKVQVTALLVLLILPMPWIVSHGYRDIETEKQWAMTPRAKSEIRNLAVALELYYDDHRSYPPAVNEKGEAIPFATEGHSISAGFVSWMLTTPEAYAGSIPFDPFRDKKIAGWARAYRYATDGKTGWILASRGPDREFDMDLAAYITDASCDITRYLTQFGGTQVEYDPTNGSLSTGDIYRTGP